VGHFVIRIFTKKQKSHQIEVAKVVFAFIPLIEGVGGGSLNILPLYLPPKGDIYKLSQVRF
jgi:hypothetical protein